MMFQSLKHPDAHIDDKDYHRAADSLFIELWQNSSLYFATIERHMAPNAPYAIPKRWTKRITLNKALKGNVCDFTSVMDVDKAHEADIITLSKKGKKKGKAHEPPPPILPNDRADQWIESLADRDREIENAKASQKQKSKGKSKATTSAATTSTKGRQDYMSSRDSRAINLAQFAHILDKLSEPLPLLLYHSSDDESALERAFKAVKRTISLVSPTASESRPLPLIFRTPMRWSSFVSHGFQDITRSWHPAAILEDIVIDLYRAPFIAGQIGGVLRQRLDAVLRPHLSEGRKVFNWPDRLQNTEKNLPSLPSPESPLSVMEDSIARYRTNAHVELLRILERVQNSFVTTINPPSSTLDSKVHASGVITSEMDLAIQALYMVSPFDSLLLPGSDLYMIQAMTSTIEENIFLYQRHVVAQGAANNDISFIIKKYPHLQSDVFNISSIAFDPSLLNRRVHDPCAVNGALNFAEISERYRQKRRAQADQSRTIASHRK